MRTSLHPGSYNNLNIIFVKVTPIQSKDFVDLLSENLFTEDLIAWS